MRTGWYPFAIARDGALSYLTVGISRWPPSVE